MNGQHLDPQNKNQVIDRVARVLKEIAHYGVAGARLKDIALGVQIPRPSVHRLLKELSTVGFVIQRTDKKYVLGPAISSLALAAPSPILDIFNIKKVAHALADQCGDVVYVAKRKFDGVLYLVRAEGSCTTKPRLIEVNDCKPFTATYSGLALLSTFPEVRRRQFLYRRALDNASSDWEEGWGWQLERHVRDKITEAENLGYCAGRGILTLGTAGIAALIPSRSCGTLHDHFHICDGGQNECRSHPKARSQLLAAAREISEFID